MQQPVILLVDDDHIALTSLRALFELETDYRLITHQNPYAALEEAKRTPLDLVISDYLMPHLNGIELLKQVRQIQPDAVRILLTGFADKENAIRAINEVGLYLYLEKPWENDALLMAVRNALEQKSLRLQLAEKVHRLDRLVRQHDELSARHRDLESQLAMAARVQRGLLPETFPSIPGFEIEAHYQPCHAVGGDFYDAARGPDSAILLVADVSGHGLQAALTSMLLKSIFQDAAGHAASPTDLLSEMDERLGRVLPEGMYAVAGTVWFTGGAMCFANAGLPYPWVLRQRQRRVERIPTAGIPLGLAPGLGGAYDEAAVALEPGDSLLVSTDGLAEARNPRKEQFDEGAMTRVLEESLGGTGGPLIREVLASAGEFSAGASQEDDITLLAVRKKL